MNSAPWARIHAPTYAVYIPAQSGLGPEPNTSPPKEVVYPSSKQLIFMLNIHNGELDLRSVTAMTAARGSGGVSSLSNVEDQEELDLTDMTEFG